MHFSDDIIPVTPGYTLTDKRRDERLGRVATEKLVRRLLETDISFFKFSISFEEMPSIALATFSRNSAMCLR